MKPDILIVIDGGTLQAVASTGEAITYRLIDLDNIRAGDDPHGLDTTTDADHVDADQFTRDWTHGITGEER